MADIGRPLKVSADIARQIAQSMAEGMTERQAAEAAGIDASSFFGWMRRGAANEGPFMEFYRIVQSAKVKARAKAALG